MEGMVALRRRIALIGVLFAAVLVLSACSLAEDVTPPPGYQEATAQESTPEPAQTVYPIVPPDPTQGAAIFAEKCAPCHGVSGQGDGAQAANLPNPAPAIGTAAVARGVKPAEWFEVVTNGNLQRFMPGFSGSLNDRQRWDVVAYALSLSSPAADVQAGQAIYTAKCQSCHGEDGHGDGPAAASLNRKLPDWSGDPSLLAQRSAQELWQVTSQGAAPAMPAFADQLSETERWQVVSYVRSFLFASASNPQPTAEAATGAEQPTGEATAAAPEITPQAAGTAAAQKLTVGGKVTNESGGALPVGATVTLQAYEGMTASFTRATTLGADGTFSFGEVEYVSGRVFVASVDYNGATFSSDVAHAAVTEGNQKLDLQIKLYDATSDASTISIQRLHVILDFAEPGKVQVAELVILVNSGSQVVAPGADGQPVIRFDLPDGATDLQFQEGALGERYVQTEKGFGDTSSILPGAGHQILFAYTLPYDRKADLRLPLPFQTDAVVVMAPNAGPKVSSPQLTSMGTRNVQNVDLNLFIAENLAAGTSLDINLAGKVRSAGAQVTGGSTTGLIIGLGALGVALLAAGVLLFRRRKAAAEDEEVEEADGVESEESLLDAIVALDDLYQAGKLPKDAYEERRAVLKERLAKLNEADDEGAAE